MVWCFDVGLRSLNYDDSGTFSILSTYRIDRNFSVRYISLLHHHSTAVGVLERLSMARIKSPARPRWPISLMILSFCLVSYLTNGQAKKSSISSSPPPASSPTTRRASSLLPSSLSHAPHQVTADEVTHLLVKAPKLVKSFPKMFKPDVIFAGKAKWGR